MQLLEPLEPKRRIFSDVAEGVENLHRSRIVGRVIKPENVLMRLVDGQIIGRAKVEKRKKRELIIET